MAHRRHMRPGRESKNVVGRLYRRANRLFSDISQRGPKKGSGEFPPLNASEDDEKVVVEAEMAGIAPEDVEIRVGSGSLTLEGERKVEAAEAIHYHRREREGGRFHRVLSLPFPVDPERATASVRNGILRITIYRVKEKEPREVKITVE